MPFWLHDREAHERVEALEKDIRRLEACIESLQRATTIYIFENPASAAFPLYPSGTRTRTVAQALNALMGKLGFRLKVTPAEEEKLSVEDASTTE